MAMKARGFSGTLAVGPSIRWDTAATVYCLIWIPLILALRLLPVSSILLTWLRL